MDHSGRSEEWIDISLVRDLVPVAYASHAPETGVLEHDFEHSFNFRQSAQAAIFLSLEPRPGLCKSAYAESWKTDFRYYSSGTASGLRN
jgi:hypothetical protein